MPDARGIGCGVVLRDACAHRDDFPDHTVQFRGESRGCSTEDRKGFGIEAEPFVFSDVPPAYPDPLLRMVRMDIDMVIGVCIGIGEADVRSWYGIPLKGKHPILPSG